VRKGRERGRGKRREGKGEERGRGREGRGRPSGVAPPEKFRSYATGSTVFTDVEQKQISLLVG